MPAQCLADYELSKLSKDELHAKLNAFRAAQAKTAAMSSMLAPLAAAHALAAASMASGAITPNSAAGQLAETAQEAETALQKCDAHIESLERALWYDTLKVDELKAECKKLGLPVGGKKKELAERLKESAAAATATAVAAADADADAAAAAAEAALTAAAQLRERASPAQTRPPAPNFEEVDEEQAVSSANEIEEADVQIVGELTLEERNKIGFDNANPNLIVIDDDDAGARADAKAAAEAQAALLAILAAQAAHRQAAAPPASNFEEARLACLARDRKWEEGQLELSALKKQCDEVEAKIRTLNKERDERLACTLAKQKEQDAIQLEQRAKDDAQRAIEPRAMKEQRASIARRAEQLAIFGVLTENSRMFLVHMKNVRALEEHIKGVKKQDVKNPEEDALRNLEHIKKLEKKLEGKKGDLKANETARKVLLEELDEE